jgi:cytoskeletal protein CcmA (bactofilin family)
MQDSRNTPPANKRTTLVEEGTAFKGTFSSDCPIVVRGRIEGNITGPSLTVSATGGVAGTVKVDVIESEGELSGEFEAQVVRLSGRVRDNTIIRAKSLEVKLAPEKGMMQVVFGECALDVGDMPSKEEVLSAAQGAQPSPPALEPPAPPVKQPSVERAELAVESAPESNADSGAQAPELAAAPVESDKAERKNGMKGKANRSRPSEMPPPPA